ncbi:unnamed protein product [Litomosoides sigmodontis]|uniref:G-protein coupled receptors family 1 profile domain-containing protein n=1 Tax=Litomosoides sigmodontis TaxID=42156 RepID=A0A3P6T5B6_LITSI|nr:unnamed protein product [Litomosoides sigmodontis]
MDHTTELVTNSFLFSLNVLQIIANLVVLLAYFTDSKLLANENIVLLVSLAAIDFFYSSLSIPYLIVLFCGWVPNGQEYHYNEYAVLGFGSGPAALMKSGCTITLFIALDRIWALWFPIKYYALNKKPMLYCVFVFSLLMASFDLSLVFILSDGIKPVSGCSAFACFTSEVFRTYWGMSNMVVNLLSCILTVVVVMLLKTRKMQKAQGNNSVVRKKEDRWVGNFENDKKKKPTNTLLREILQASRASLYILIVSAIFGVVPGGINGYAQKIQSDFIKSLAFYIQLCASISGLSHAFIFGMAHSLIRQRVIVMLKLTKYFKPQIPYRSRNSIFSTINHKQDNLMLLLPAYLFVSTTCRELSDFDLGLLFATIGRIHAAYYSLSGAHPILFAELRSSQVRGANELCWKVASDGGYVGGATGRVDGVGEDEKLNFVEMMTDDASRRITLPQLASKDGYIDGEIGAATA